MKGPIFPVCLFLLLVVAGIPAAASPVISSVSPSSGPNNGAVAVAITGSGFNSHASVWMTPASVCDPTTKIYGTGCSWSPTSGTCAFSIQGQIPGPYTVWINSPIIDSIGNEIPDVGSLHNAFVIYQGTGSYTPPAVIPVTTTYGSPGPYGTIYVESSPSGAVIYLNDENKGPAPVTITDLWPGSYTITAKLAGFQEYTTATTISGPTRSPVYCQLVPDNSANGYYVVSTPDRANVYLDGGLKGETPLMISNTTSGLHTIQVRLSGYDEWKSTVEAPANGTKTISATLRQNDAALIQGINVSSKPSGADVILDGLKKGVTPITLNNIAEGIHILEVGYSGYTPWKSTIDVPKKAIKEISITLTPKPGSSPGWITVISSPCNALVTLDGTYVGQTPANSSLNLDLITPGEHTLGLALPGYEPYFTNVTISPNLVSAVNTTLIPVSGPVAKGTLFVTSDPAGATISVDNIFIGISPLTAGDLAVGDHQVTMSMEGYQDYSTSILVTAGTTSNISATLQSVPSTLHSPVFPFTALGALGSIGILCRRKKILNFLLRGNNF